jgi:pyrroloquinoline-quinone synthase
MLAYFRSRVPRARRDSEEAIEYVTTHATSYALQRKCVEALIAKTQILWHLLDCVWLAHFAEPRMTPPAFAEDAS